MSSLGRMLILGGAVLMAVGLLILVASRFPGLRIGRLPGDIYIERERFRFYFPLATSIALSIALTVVLWLMRRR